MYRSTYTVTVCLLVFRHVTLFEEFLLLRDFEKHENVIVSKLEGKQQEKFDMQEKVCGAGL